MRSFLISMGVLLAICVAAVTLQQFVDAPNRDAVVVMAMLPAMAFVFIRFRGRVHQYVEFRKQGGAAPFDRWTTMSSAERRERVRAARPRGRAARHRAAAAAAAATAETADTVERPAGWVPAPGAHITDDEVADLAADMAVGPVVDSVDATSGP